MLSLDLPAQPYDNLVTMLHDHITTLQQPSHNPSMLQNSCVTATMGQPCNNVALRQTFDNLVTAIHVNVTYNLVTMQCQDVTYNLVTMNNVRIQPCGSDTCYNVRMLHTTL